MLTDPGRDFWLESGWVVALRFATGGWLNAKSDSATIYIVRKVSSLRKSSKCLRSSASSLRKAASEARKSASASRAFIRSVTVGRPQLCLCHVPMISGRLSCRNSSTGLVEIGFAGTARSKRRRLRLSGCADSVSSPALSLDSRLLRFLVVRGSALVGMVDGPVVSTASLLGLAGVGAVVWVCSPGC